MRRSWKFGLTHLSVSLFALSLASPGETIFAVDALVSTAAPALTVQQLAVSNDLRPAATSNEPRTLPLATNTPEPLPLFSQQSLPVLSANDSISMLNNSVQRAAALKPTTTGPAVRGPINGSAPTAPSLKNESSDYATNYKEAATKELKKSSANPNDSAPTSTSAPTATAPTTVVAPTPAISHGATLGNEAPTLAVPSESTPVFIAPTAAASTIATPANTNEATLNSVQSPRNEPTLATPPAAGNTMRLIAPGMNNASATKTPTESSRTLMLQPEEKSLGLNEPADEIQEVPAKPTAEQSKTVNAPKTTATITTMPQAVETSNDSANTPTDSEYPTETVTERYPNSLVKITRHVTQDAQGNFLNHGAWNQFDQQGKMIGGGDYSLGEKSGRWVRLFSAQEAPMFTAPMFKEFVAPFAAEVTYKADQLNGVWRVVDSKNRKMLEWPFVNNQLHGKSVWYHSNGTVRREIPYVHGDIHGAVMEYAIDGKESKKEIYMQGRKLALQTDMHDAQTKSSEGWSLLAKESLKPNFDFWNGVANYTVLGEEGKNQRHGQWIWWHRNGQKQMEGAYDHDQPEGQFAWWYANGQKQIEGKYLNGVQEGKFIWWHANGTKMMEGEYVAGKQINEWRRWKEDGKMSELARYSTTGEQLEFKQFNTAKPGEEAAKENTAATPAAQPEVKKERSAAVSKEPSKLNKEPVTLGKEPQQLGKETPSLGKETASLGKDSSEPDIAKQLQPTNETSKFKR